MALVTSTAAAAVLGVSRRTVLRMVRDGELKPAEVTPGGEDRGGRNHFELELLESMIAGRNLDADRTRAALAAAEAVAARVARKR